MESYSATKKNKIINFAGIWMEIEKNIILSEVAQTQKDNFACSPSSEASIFKISDVIRYILK